MSESQSEAHRLIARHLEATIPDSNAVALNRNNSADRLEPTIPLEPGSPLSEPLQEAKPRSCMAVRLNRSYERSDASEEIMECEICGKLPDASVCQPLLVGGEVIARYSSASAGRPPTPTAAASTSRSPRPRRCSRTSGTWRWPSGAPRPTR